MLYSHERSVPFTVRIPRAAPVLRRAFVAASATWAAALPAAVYAGTRAHVAPLVGLLVAGIYAFGSIVCHQLPERSFQLWGAQMPVCARCTGIYVGAALAALLDVVSGFSRTLSRWRPRTVRLKADATYSSRILLVLAALPTIATLAFEWTTGVMPSNSIRALAGFPLGAAAAAIVLAAEDNQVN